jgi:hypothetical protein
VRAWGYDYYAGKDYSHRKEWIIERFQELSKIFAEEICASAVMSDHYHLVFIDAACSGSGDDEVALAQGLALM